MSNPIDPEAFGGNYGFVDHTYGEGTAERVWTAGATYLDEVRERGDNAEVFGTAVDLKILFGANVLDEDEHAKLQLKEIERVDMALRADMDDVAAIFASAYRLYFGSKPWAHGERQRMFDGTETAIEIALREDERQDDVVLGLDRPVLASRVLFEKSQRAIHTRAHQNAWLLDIRTARAIQKPADSKPAADDGRPATDWDHASAAADVRLLNAVSLSYDENGVIIIDKPMPKLVSRI
jgi:hypothetical protein